MFVLFLPFSSFPPIFEICSFEGICKNIDIEGVFSGKLQAEGMLNVKSKAHITGEVIVGKLAVEPGARFEASCEMRSS